MIGPLDFVIFGFEGDRFSPAVVRDLDAIRADGTIRVLDVLFVVKDEAGGVTVREVSDLSDEEVEALGVIDVRDGDVERFGWLAEDDVEAVAAELPTSTSAIAMVFEHVWIRRMRSAVIEAGGFVVAEGRVPADVVGELETTMAAEERASS